MKIAAEAPQPPRKALLSRHDLAVKENARRMFFRSIVASRKSELNMLVLLCGRLSQGFVQLCVQSVALGVVGGAAAVSSQSTYHVAVTTAPSADTALRWLPTIAQVVVALSRSIWHRMSSLGSREHDRVVHSCVIRPFLPRSIDRYIQARLYTLAKGRGERRAGSVCR